MHDERYDCATGNVYGIFSSRKKAEKAIERKAQLITDHLTIKCVYVDPSFLSRDYCWNDIEGLER